ncbi:MAG TPA: hypothetical protein VIK18_10425, partial [Pirellulales bacterium]
RLGLPEPVDSTFQLFAGQSAAGLGVQLPGWRYPVVCDTASGQLRYDNFGGHWGDQQALDRFMQSYATEKARIEAHKLGHSVSEQLLADGSIKLTILATGG